MNTRWFLGVLLLLMVSCGCSGKTILLPSDTDTPTVFVTPSKVEETDVVLTPPTATLPINEQVGGDQSA